MSLDPHFPEVAEWVRDHCDPARSLCLCGYDLRGEEVRGYRHDAGWETNSGKMWLYIHCPKCGYDMAISKIGVPRAQDFRTRGTEWLSESDQCDLAWAAPDPRQIIEFPPRWRR